MKSNSKRLVSLLICLAMVLAVLPMAVFAAGTTKVYCDAPDDWTFCNVYWWGSAGENPGWPGMAMTQDGDGLWYYEVPSDAAGIIFNNKEGENGLQTGDLTVPTDNKVKFDILANNWGTKNETVQVITKYYVAGQAALCGVEWNPGAEENLMTENADGTWSKTYPDVAAGTYEFKVTKGSWTESWGGDGPGGNYLLTVESQDDVTITFDPAAGTISVKIGNEEILPPAPEPIVVDSIYVAGVSGLTGAEWDPANEAAKMSGSNGVYTITFTGIAAGTYEFKFAANGEWTHSWGAGITLNPDETVDAAYNGGNNTIIVGEDNATVKLTLDLSAMAEDGSGAKCTASFAAGEAPEPDPIVVDYIIAVGNAGLVGAEWDPANEAAKMKVKNGVYTITFNNVAAGTYEFKFAANGEWTHSWGNGAAVESGAEVDAYYNGGNNTLTVAEDGSTVKLTLDLSAMDEAGNGAKCTAVVTAPADVEDPEDPTVKPEDPTVKPEDPTVKPEDPTVKPEDPTVKPEDPTVKPEDPTVKPEDPTVKPEDPTVKPEDPTVKPEDPTVKPEDPTVKPEDPTDKPEQDPQDPTDAPADPEQPEDEPTEAPTEAPKELSEFRVTGSADFLGNWDAANESGRMYDYGNGIYKITYKNVAVGEYQFKVTKGSWDENWGGDGPDGNYVINVAVAGDVTITFNANDGSISVALPGQVTPPTGDVSMSAVFAALLAASAGLVCTVSKKKEF